MKRYQPLATMSIPENEEGVFCLFSDTVELLQCAIKFAMEHAEEIKSDTDGFGTLKPILAMIPEARH